MTFAVNPLVICTQHTNHIRTTHLVIIDTPFPQTITNYIALKAARCTIASPCWSISCTTISRSSAPPIPSNNTNSQIIGVTLHIVWFAGWCTLLSVAHHTAQCSTVVLHGCSKSQRKKTTQRAVNLIGHYRFLLPSVCRRAWPDGCETNDSVIHDNQQQQQQQHRG